MEELLKEREKEGLFPGFLLHYICPDDNTRLAGDGLRLVPLAVRDAKCKRGILVGRSLQELRVLRELFQKVSEHVSITTYEEIEKQAFTWMPSIARHILFGDGDEEVETVSFGHGFDVGLCML